MASGPETQPKPEARKTLEPVVPFIKVDPRLRVVSLRYKVPIEILASIKLDPEKVARAYRTGNDRTYFELASVKGKVTIMGRPLAFGAVAKEDEVWIKLTLPVGTFYWVMPRTEFVKTTPEQWYEKLSSWFIATAERRPIKKTKNGTIYGWFIRKIAWLKIDEDVESFKWLVEKLRGAGHDDPILNAMLLLLRYNPKVLSEDAKSTLVARIIPLVATEPIHTIELTIPGTGKSTVATMYSFTLNWLYFTEPPSVATLIGDARTGKSTIAGARGVWLDEIDKWTRGTTKREDLRQAIEAMLTGMEQGLWIRGKGGEKQIKVYNPIPVYLSGNVGLTPAHPREVVMSVIEAIVGRPGALAFNERITVAVSVHKDVADEIQRSVLPTIVRPSVLRGAVKYLQMKYAELNDPPDHVVDSRFKGRFRRHVKRVAKALAVLFERTPDDPDVIAVAEKLVEGYVAC